MNNPGYRARNIMEAERRMLNLRGGLEKVPTEGGNTDVVQDHDVQGMIIDCFLCGIARNDSQWNRREADDGSHAKLSDRAYRTVGHGLSGRHGGAGERSVGYANSQLI